MRQSRSRVQWTALGGGDGARNLYLNDESNLLLANFNDTDNMFSKNVSRYLKATANDSSVNNKFINETNTTFVPLPSSTKRNGSSLKQNYNLNDNNDLENNDEDDKYQ